MHKPNYDYEPEKPPGVKKPASNNKGKQAAANSKGKTKDIKAALEAAAKAKQRKATTSRATSGTKGRRG